MPVEDLGDVALDPGFGFEATVGYRIMPHAEVYGGWDWHRFPADAPLAASELDVEETGYAFGVRFQHPLGGSQTVALRLRAGGTYNHIEIEDADGELLGDSGHGLGWEAGAGLALLVGRGWELSPGARFRSLSREVELDGVGVDATLRYVALEVGVARRF